MSGICWVPQSPRRQHAVFALQDGLQFPLSWVENLSSSNRSSLIWVHWAGHLFKISNDLDENRSFTYRTSPKKSPLETTLLLLKVCYYTSWNLKELNMKSSSLRQNNLAKTISQIIDFLFTYMKFKAIDHAFRHVPYFGRRKE